MDDFKDTEHESFAMLDISRVNSNRGQNLFGSSIKHSNTICIKISPAKISRSLNRDWFRAIKLPYIEIEMSYSQFAEAITSLNHGEGVPVTLTRLNGRDIEPCIQFDKRQQFEAEFESKMLAIGETLRILTKNTEKLLNSKKPPTKSEKDIILNDINSLKQEIEKNIPFIQQSFNKQMDKTVLEAKGEVEGFMMHKIISAGLEGLQNEMKMLGNDSEEILELDVASDAK